MPKIVSKDYIPKSVIENIKSDLRNNDITPKSYETFNTFVYVKLNDVLNVIDKHINGREQ